MYTSKLNAGNGSNRTWWNTMYFILESWMHAQINTWIQDHSINFHVHYRNFIFYPYYFVKTNFCMFKHVHDSIDDPYSIYIFYSANSNFMRHYCISRNISEDLILASLARLLGLLKLCITNNTSHLNITMYQWWLKLHLPKIWYSIFRMKSCYNFYLYSIWLKYM